jgi:hypothetical protein
MRRSIVPLVFALVVMLQLAWFGVPTSHAVPTPNDLSTVFDPLLAVVTGFLVYVLRAAVVAALVGLALKFF